MSKIISLVLVVLFLTSCKNKLEDVERITEVRETNVETAYDVNLLYSDSAVVKVKVQGPKMVRHLEDNPRDEFTNGIKVDFFGAGGEVQSVLTAKYAVRYETGNTITVRDSVVWESENQERLETEELIWDEKKQKVYSTRFCKITKPEEVVYGYGFEANQDFTEWKITQGVGELKVEEFDDEEGVGSERIN